MSICKSGMDGKFLKAQKITVEVSPAHPLIKLMNALDWAELEKLIQFRDTDNLSTKSVGNFVEEGNKPVNNSLFMNQASKKRA